MTAAEEEIFTFVKTWNDSFMLNESETYFTYIHDDLTLFIPSCSHRMEGKSDDKEKLDWYLSK